MYSVENNSKNKYKVDNSMYCNNCNNYGHLNKKCIYPYTSNGVISFIINKFDIKKMDELEKYIEKRINENIKENEENIENEDIKFIMVQRKNSLGYIEFIRGKYNENIMDCNEKLENLLNPSINYLIKQMNVEEINNIINCEFDELWLKLWNNNGIHNNYHLMEYNNSKIKFYLIRQKYKKEDLKKPAYSFNEWGFPKGRRNKYENDLECALREFNEETNIKKENLHVFNKINKIQENMIGTNGVKYLHNYFLAYVNDYTEIKTDNCEIGDIQLLTINECLNLIRPYHIEKKNVLKKIFLIINEFIKK